MCFFDPITQIHLVPKFAKCNKCGSIFEGVISESDYDALNSYCPKPKIIDYFNVMVGTHRIPYLKIKECMNCKNTKKIKAQKKKPLKSL